MTAGPWLIYDTETGALYNADGRDHGERRSWWVYHQAKATAYPTRGAAEAVIRERFSRLTRGRNIVIRADAPPAPRKQLDITFARPYL